MKHNGLEMSTMNDVVDEVVWQAAIRSSDMHSLTDETKIKFISDLSKAIQSICWSYGVHN